jgi:Predicted branched-chain amino acid permease (azaleucine resistance)
MQKHQKIKKAFAAAFPYTIPILAGFLFVGAAYGIFMNTLGFAPWYPMLTSAIVFAGSMEFVAADLLLGAFDPLGAFLLTLMVNARHLFYGLSMLDKYKDTGKKKAYLIFGMCDETFSINCTANIPPDVDSGWFMFFITCLNHFYWVLGVSIGSLLGTLVRFNTKGLDFVMTALFIVIFLEQWFKDDAHHSALVGIGVSVGCLLLFGADRFIIPAMLLILICLIGLRRPIEKAGALQ